MRLPIRHVAFALAAVTSAAFGCSSSSDAGGGTEGDGGIVQSDSSDSDQATGPADSGIDTGISRPDSSPDSSATAACNDLTVGAYSSQEQIATAPPAPTGGTIPDGQYDLVDGIQYTGPGGASAQLGTSTTAERLEVTGNTWQLATSVNGMLGAFTQTVTFSGTSATFTSTCGLGLDGATPYSFDGTTLTLYEFGQIALVFQKH